jgi:NADH dehydrogenase FAD-containing subunit
LPISSELVGEIKDFYPDIEVTIVNRGPLPVNDTYPASFRQRLVDEMRARGIKVILEDEVDNLSPAVLDGSDPVTPGRKIKTKKGVEIAADLIVSSHPPICTL